MGVWIEIVPVDISAEKWYVHPLVGVWIEIALRATTASQAEAFTPLWGCGLKYPNAAECMQDSRSPPCGGVD